MRPIITLLTDFGVQQTYVGQMKGAILALNPEVTIVDLTHAIPPQQRLIGALALAESIATFPRGTIHVAVVDPGVGSTRRAVVIDCETFWLVGPDNGLFSAVLARWPAKAVYVCRENEFWRHPVAPTFHGRDVFAPTASALSRGVPIDQLAERSDSPLVPLELPAVRVDRQRAVGQILWIDGFGNAITNIDRGRLPAGCVPVRITSGSLTLTDCESFYSAVPPGQPLALWDSSGRLELAVHAGHAADRYGLSPGQSVEIDWEAIPPG